jgi:hypothetical protein
MKREAAVSSEEVLTDLRYIQVILWGAPGGPPEPQKKEKKRGRGRKREEEGEKERERGRTRGTTYISLTLL